MSDRADMAANALKLRLAQDAVYKKEMFDYVNKFITGEFDNVVGLLEYAEYEKSWTSAGGYNEFPEEAELSDEVGSTAILSLDDNSYIDITVYTVDGIFVEVNIIRGFSHTDRPVMIIQDEEFLAKEENAEFVILGNNVKERIKTLLQEKNGLI